MTGRTKFIAATATAMISMLSLFPPRATITPFVTTPVSRGFIFSDLNRVQMVSGYTPGNHGVAQFTEVPCRIDFERFTLELISVFSLATTLLLIFHSSRPVTPEIADS